MVSIVNFLLCILTITTFTSASRCPEGILRLTFEPNGTVFTCPTSPLKPHKVSQKVNILAVCPIGNETIDQNWIVCEDPYGHCATVSCNTTKALYLQSNCEEHRLVVSAGKEIR
eukprot:PhF_6_TR18896/c0_g5_i2/m.27541